MGLKFKNHNLDNDINLKWTPSCFNIFREYFFISRHKVLKDKYDKLASLTSENFRVLNQKGLPAH